MSANKKENLIVGLDIGTTKICAIVGNVTEDGIDIVGIGTSPSSGLRKGVVINIESTVASIRKAIDEAELMAGCEIKSVYAGIAGGHIKGINSQGVIAIKNREVAQEDVRRVIDAAKAIAIPMDREVIHILPQEFIIDEQDGIREPLGMSGVRLEAKVHIVTGAVASAQNIVKSCNRAGLDVADIVLEQLASSEAVLSPDEKELGVCLVDIGGGTTDIAIFADGAIKYTSVLSLGGQPADQRHRRRPADTLWPKRKRSSRSTAAACRHWWARKTRSRCPASAAASRATSPATSSARYSEPRVEEIFTLVNREIVKSGLEDSIASGVVITGGSSILEGMPELAEQIFNLPVRRGLPQKIGGLVDVVNSPVYATGVGLVVYGSRNSGTREHFKEGGSDDSIFNTTMRRMKTWFKEFF